MQKVILKPGRDKALMRHHPWLFSGALYETDNDINNGETVNIVSNGGEILAQDAYSPHSQICIRLWTLDPLEKIDAEFFKGRIEHAITRCWV